jgi:hypothetical protein
MNVRGPAGCVRRRALDRAAKISVSATHNPGSGKKKPRQSTDGGLIERGFVLST